MIPKLTTEDVTAAGVKLEWNIDVPLEGVGVAKLLTGLDGLKTNPPVADDTTDGKLLLLGDDTLTVAAGNIGINSVHDTEAVLVAAAEVTTSV